MRPRILVLFCFALTGCLNSHPVALVSGQRRSPAPDQMEIANGNNQFALDLYARLRQKEGNLIASPVSISTALAMTYAGARRDTAREMKQTLHLPFEGERLHSAFGALYRDLNATHSGYQLRMANALWAQKEAGLHSDFVKISKDKYGAGLREVNFSEHGEQVRGEINRWVEQQTQDKIRNLVGQISPETRLMLVDAVYFKGVWANQFDKENTTLGSWARQRSVQLMHQSGGKFKYTANGSFQALEMPYIGNDVSMVVFLPEKTDGLPEFEKSLNAVNLSLWLSQMRETEVAAVFLPKFKMTCNFELGGVLADMGMPGAFSALQADFSGINGKRDLCLGDVVHKAFVEFNELGTEAAAATAIAVGAALGIQPPKPIIFRADHPFLFLIRENRFGNILFIGRLEKPVEG